MKDISFAAACLDYFGKKQGQSSVEFMNELRALTDKDKVELKAMFPSVGYNITSVIAGQ